MDKAGLNRAEKVSSIILVAFGLFVAFYSRHYLKLGIMITPGAGFLPYCIGVSLMVLGAIWFLVILFPRKAEGGQAEAESVPGVSAGGDESRPNLILHRFLPAVLLVVLYAWLFERAGYILSTVLFIVGWQKVVERERWLKTAVMASVCAGGMYILFSYLLKVFLPTGSWFS